MAMLSFGAAIVDAEGTEVREQGDFDPMQLHSRATQKDGAR